MNHANKAARSRPAASVDTTIIWVVDDDAAMRQAISFLLDAAGHAVQECESAEVFLKHFDPGRRGCILLDVRMPGMSGLDLQKKLRADSVDTPVIIVTAHGDVPMAVQAMRQGAFDFVQKPFKGDELLQRVAMAVARDNDQHTRQHERRQIESRLAQLTPREREILLLIADGLISKQIAAELDISLKTVENHRAHIMEKMQAEGLADLVRMSVIGGLA
jgi:RNA polymerase sigma factor (sigma-70 family)